MFQIGSKVNIGIGGRRVPGVIVSTPYPAVSEYTSKDPAREGELVQRPTWRAQVVSLRETNPDGPNAGQIYLTSTDENLSFVASRSSSVVGLDGTADGEAITVAMAEDLAFDSLLAFQTARLAAQAPAELAI